RPVRDSFYGSWSNDISASTILSDVARLKVKAASTDRMKLTWKKVKGATQYVILRSEQIDGTYEVIGHSPKASYTDTGLQGGTTYFYKVYAVSGPYRTKETAPVGQMTKIPKVKK
ncbi:MAG: fibronectin type III domain-containing protein, partial [Lachnospiraceae bacterium]|nr:fibronectin type III domain-containing protein [Lachnospiraceae bacterium]